MGIVLEFFLTIKVLNKDVIFLTHCKIVFLISLFYYFADFVFWSKKLAKMVFQNAKRKTILIIVLKTFW